MIHKLDDLIADKISGEWGTEGTPENGVKVIRTANFTNEGVINYDNLVYRTIDPRKVDSKRLQKGDIIIEKSGGSPNQPVGRVVFFDLKTDEPFLCNNFTSILRPNKNLVHPKYLFYRLFEGYKEGRTLKYQNKTTGIINLKLENYLQEKLDIPDTLEDQTHIANILSKAEALIAQRKESLCLLDEFLKSTFLEMFGDPVRNEKGWEKDSFENLVAEDCPLTYGIVQPGEEFPDGVPVIRPVDLTQTIVKKDGLKRIDPKISEKFKRTILRGDEILMCVRGTTGIISLSSNELRGCNVTRGITPIWFSDSFNVLFAFGLLKSQAINIEIQKLTYGATLKQINLSDLRKIQLINPPLKLQTQFAHIVEKTEALKVHYQTSLQELENLYGSLSQKAFKGELKGREELSMAAEDKPKYSKA